MMFIPAREFTLSPTNNIDGLSAVALACQGSDWFSIDVFGVYGSCSMSKVLEFLADLPCLQGRPTMYPRCGVKPKLWDTYSTRLKYRHCKHQNRNRSDFLGRMNGPYYAVVNRTACQQGTVGPLLLKDKWVKISVFACLTRDWSRFGNTGTFWKVPSWPGNWPWQNLSLLGSILCFP
jgi:hypothetical protein